MSVTLEQLEDWMGAKEKEHLEFKALLVQPEHLVFRVQVEVPVQLEQQAFKASKVHLELLGQQDPQVEIHLIAPLRLQ